MLFLHVVGARPNFMKAAPVYRALASFGHDQVLVHTGQHYDPGMSEVFFRDLELVQPDENLNVGSCSHAQQTSMIMSRLEPIVLSRRPDVVVVYGDVNSTLAAALVCSKERVRLVHVEAGLRSFDRTMPEEINRIITDQLADRLFTPSIDGDENLAREGVPSEKIFLVGNVMIDTLIRLLPKAEQRFAELSRGLALDAFGLVTLHRPANVDEEEAFLPIVAILQEISRQVRLVFPVHPRTRAKWLPRLAHGDSNLTLIDPLGYLDFLALQNHAKFIITDSGGIQEESTFLGVPCFTLRDSTERPTTVSLGSNTLIGRNWELLRLKTAQALAGTYPYGTVPALWDGKASERIAEVLSEWKPDARRTIQNASASSQFVTGATSQVVSAPAVDSNAVGMEQRV